MAAKTAEQKAAEKAAKAAEKAAATPISYKFSIEVDITDETSPIFGKHEAGSTIELTSEQAGPFVADGTLVAPAEKPAPTKEDGSKGTAPAVNVPLDEEGFPISEVRGKFHSVAFKEGAVVFNQFGQRATDVVSDAEAKDLVGKSNRDAGIKVK